MPASSARLTVAGATREEVEPLLLEHEGVEIAGRVPTRREVAPARTRPTCSARRRSAARASAWCSPRRSPPARRWSPPISRATATSRATAWTACSCPPGDPVALGEALHSLALDPASARARWPTPPASAPSASPGRTWPREVDGGLRGGAQRPAARGARGRALAQRLGVAPAEPGTARAAAAPAARSSRRTRPRTRRAARAARRVLVVGGRGGRRRPGRSRAPAASGSSRSAARSLAATPVWVLVAFALMCASMLLRAEAWHAILRAALPGIRVRRRDAARGTMIGVLMSATLPARLGEPSRALIVARRVGPRARSLPDRARHARLADDPEHPRAGGARRCDVHDRRPLPGQRGRARGGHDRAAW